MDIDLIFKIAAVGIIVSILNQVLVRSGREEQATMTSLAALVVVLMCFSTSYRIAVIAGVIWLAILFAAYQLTQAKR